MEFSYNISIDELEKRKRLNKKFAKKGEIVAFQHRFGNQCLLAGVVGLRIGLLLIESGNELVPGMLIYESTDAEKMWVYGTRLSKEYWKEKVENETTLLDFLLNRIENLPYSEVREQLFTLPVFIEEEEAQNFKEEVWDACKGKIGAIGMNFNREKTELYTILIAEAMIVGTDRSQENCLELSVLLHESWNVFSVVYSLFYGRNITTDHTHFVELLSRCAHQKYSCYLKLILLALGEKEQKVEKILRYSPADNREKLKEKVIMLERQRDLTEQNTELDELFEILFPKTFQDYLKTDNPYASMDEIQAELQNSKELKTLLFKAEEFARILEQELGDSIKMEDLKEALIHCTPDRAFIIFAQLDMVLEGHNKAWDRNRVKLKQYVNQCYEDSRGLLEDTRSQTLLATRYSKMAAERPAMKDNNGIVAGGNVHTAITLTDEQARMLFPQLRLTTERRVELLENDK